MSEILLPIFLFIVGYVFGQAFPLHWVISKITGRN
jgi:hypothetical protein